MPIKPVSGKIESQEINDNLSYLENRVSTIITTPIEGINEEEIIDARDGEKSLGDNMRGLRYGVETGVINLTVNGDFTEGADGLFAWANYSGTDMISSNGKLIMTGNGDFTQTRVRQSDDYGLSDLPYIEGHKFFIKGDFKVMNSDATAVGFDVFGTEGSGNVITIAKSDPQMNTTYRISDIVKLNGRSGNLIVQLKTFYESSSLANGKATEVDNIVVINLTETFGEGNEPSNQEMNYLLSYFTESFFKGVASAGKLSTGILNIMLSRFGKTDLGFFNGVINGNFEGNSKSPWLDLSGASGTVNNNTLVVIGTGTNDMVREYQITNISIKKGDKVYISGLFEVDNNDTRMVRFYLNSGTNPTNNETFFGLNAMVKDKEYHISGIMNIYEDTTDDKAWLYVRADYPSPDIANGKIMKVRKVVGLNLTEIYGAGNEPTREDMDSLIKYLPDQYFNLANDSHIQEASQRVYMSELSRIKRKGFKSPLIAFTIDDGNLTDYTNAYPLFQKKGIKGTSYIVNKWVDSNDSRWLNHEQIQEMYESGWEFQCHTAHHEHLDTYSEQEIHKEFQIQNDLFDRLNLPQPEHHAYPFGDYNHLVINVGLQYRKTLRATGKTSGIDYNEYDRLNPGALNARSIDITYAETDRLEEIKRAIDNTVYNQGALILYMHQVKEIPDDQYQAQLSIVEEIIDYALQYINAGRLLSVTHKEMYDIITAYNR